ncbi:putative ribonuclease H protein, partial [Trifolium medium]|nr:putative ribonuclease H protein [Trifolium medium]
MVSNFLSHVVRDVRGQSLWWRDIMKIGGEENEGWFRSNVSNVLGHGNIIRFWQDKWLGPVSFNILFPSLFNKSAHKEVVIEEAGGWNNGAWMWNLIWTDQLSSEELEAEAELQVLLADITPKKDIADSKNWIPSKSGFFSVLSTY